MADTGTINATMKIKFIKFILYLQCNLLSSTWMILSLFIQSHYSSRRSDVLAGHFGDMGSSSAIKEVGPASSQRFVGLRSPAPPHQLCTNRRLGTRTCPSPSSENSLSLEITTKIEIIQQINGSCATINLELSTAHFSTGTNRRAEGIERRTIRHFQPACLELRDALTTIL
jgi:hypothetical protein